MIVWLASYPRSGNTFLRIALHRMFRVTSSVVYDVDGVADRLGRDLVGWSEGGSIAELRASSGVHLVKTHRPYDVDIGDGDRAICLVRDGRDAVVSWARQLAEPEPTKYDTVLAELVDFPERRGVGSWGTNVLSWLDAPLGNGRATVLFEDLINDATRVVGSIVEQLGLRQDCPLVASPPTFADLQKVDPRFFRRGRVGGHVHEMPVEVVARFEAHVDNASALRRMTLLSRE